MCFAVLIWPVTARLLMNVIKQNSLVRRFISKEKDINAVPEYVIQKVQDWINRFPRRLLGYHTPEELFKEQITRLSSAA